jgi:hypothetical protein
MGNGLITTLSFFHPGPIISIEMIILLMIYGIFTSKYLKPFSEDGQTVSCTVLPGHGLSVPLFVTSIREINRPMKNKVCGQLTMCCSSFF